MLNRLLVNAVSFPINPIYNSLTHIWILVTLPFSPIQPQNPQEHSRFGVAKLFLLSIQKFPQWQSFLVCADSNSSDWRVTLTHYPTVKHPILSPASLGSPAAIHTILQLPVQHRVTLLQWHMFAAVQKRWTSMLQWMMLMKSTQFPL